MPKSLTVPIFLICLLLFPSNTLSAQENNTFGGWEHLEVAHTFKNTNLYGYIYFEHDNFQYQRLDFCFISVDIGYKFTNWLKTSVAYDFFVEPIGIGHRAIADITGTLKEGNLSLSLRERYQHRWSMGNSSQGNELRSRLKAQYSIPESRLKPYLAIEVYTWEKWQKTRHYIGSAITLDNHFELEAYYMYYLFANKPAEHVFVLGLNENL